ncbi:hypothetical protein G7048_12960 [Diaphorobacter sp. HDW4B]|uniref:hypothetical protein n=1 Tax=Diaphorobacter sp. HDW4B TaxID=2714925 RepID=UPI00140B036F|nr:hypothetical protein [Diaphorobacter sp. HDW4B]QIL71191.1 hypothetical protein G7048_12960 [Diaphorobacter sp. HDW4B]
MLSYLQSVLEGRNEQRLHRWLRENTVSLRALLSSPDVAKLKFKPIEFARSLLARHSVAYVENPARIQREMHLLGLGEDCFDETGELRPDYYQWVFDGLFCEFLAGDEQRGRKRITQYLCEHQDEGQPLLAEPLEDLLLFAEREFAWQPDLARAIVSTMAAFFEDQEISMQEVDRVAAKLLG